MLRSDPVAGGSGRREEVRMTLNHVHLAGPDVRALRRFYEKWFGFKKTADHGKGAFLRDAAGFLIAIDPVPAARAFPKWFHLGFCLDGPDAVRALHRRMKAARVPIARDLIDFEGEAAAFYCLDPAGTKIEVSWHASDE
jgi:catechol 2,3-dioxygenase-like lactoylglutathione lyase family enzyme